jgi:hypothetical protein
VDDEPLHCRAFGGCRVKRFGHVASPAASTDVAALHVGSPISHVGADGMRKANPAAATNGFEAVFDLPAGVSRQVGFMWAAATNGGLTVVLGMSLLSARLSGWLTPR